MIMTEEEMDEQIELMQNETQYQYADKENGIMDFLVKMLVELKVRQHSEYIKDWLRSHDDLELDPIIENEVIRVIDDATNSFIRELKE